jgi:hypothetical protein
VRVWAIHAIFAAILVGSLAAKERTAAPFEDSPDLLEPVVLSVAASEGLRLLETGTASKGTPRVLVFEAPGCSHPMRVSLRLWTFEQESLLQRVPDLGYTRRYIYLDRTWDAPNPRAVFFQRMKYKWLAMFGLTEYVPSRYLLLVEAPVDCRAAETIDWRSVWSRRNLAAEVNAPAIPKG